MDNLRAHAPEWLERLKVVLANRKNRTSILATSGGYDRNMFTPEAVWAQRIPATTIQSTRARFPCDRLAMVKRQLVLRKHDTEFKIDEWLFE